MKGIYVICDKVTEKDRELIGKARRIFPYVTVAISLPFWRDENYTLHRDIVSDIRKMNVYSGGLETSEVHVGLSIDFFEEGGLENFLKKSNAVSWVVPRGVSAELVRSIDFPKYFIY
ncbi:MAG: hypothetical protein WCI72_05070 [archaeon]